MDLKDDNILSVHTNFVAIPKPHQLIRSVLTVTPSLARGLMQQLLLVQCQVLHSRTACCTLTVIVVERH